MIGFLLLIVAWVLLLPATLVNVILVASKSKKRGWVKFLGGYFKKTAEHIDVFAADEFMTLWNTILVKKEGDQFIGNHRTISYYLGSNQRTDTLTWFGKFIAWILDSLDKDHCKKTYFIEWRENLYN